LAQQTRHLGGHGKANVFGVRHRGANGAVFIPAFILLLSSGFGAASLPEGGNPLGERRLSFRCWPAVWAGFF
jgi:hypothetical protein